MKKVSWQEGYSKLVHQSALFISLSVRQLLQHWCMPEPAWWSPCSVATQSYICKSLLCSVNLTWLYFAIIIWKRYKKKNIKEAKLFHSVLILTVVSTQSVWLITITQGYMPHTEHLFAVILMRINREQNVVRVGDLCCTFWLFQPIWAGFFPFI